jgi:hypothetical protein
VQTPEKCGPFDFSFQAVYTPTGSSITLEYCAVAGVGWNDFAVSILTAVHWRRAMSSGSYRCRGRIEGALAESRP